MRHRFFIAGALLAGLALPSLARAQFGDPKERNTDLDSIHTMKDPCTHGDAIQGELDRQVEAIQEAGSHRRRRHRDRCAGAETATRRWGNERDAARQTTGADGETMEVDRQSAGAADASASTGSAATSPTSVPPAFRPSAPSSAAANGAATSGGPWHFGPIAVGTSPVYVGRVGAVDIWVRSIPGPSTDRGAQLEFTLRNSAAKPAFLVSPRWNGHGSPMSGHYMNGVAIGQTTDAGTVPEDQIPPGGSIRRTRWSEHMTAVTSIEVDIDGVTYGSTSSSSAQ